MLLGAICRYIMRIGSASSAYPLTDSELPKTSCYKLFPTMQRRQETTEFDADGKWLLSFSLAGALAEVATTITSINSHMKYAAEFEPLRELLKTKDVGAGAGEGEGEGEGAGEGEGSMLARAAPPAPFAHAELLVPSRARTRAHKHFELGRSDCACVIGGGGI